MITDVPVVGSPDLRVSGSSAKKVDVISMHYIETKSIIKIRIQHDIFIYDCIILLLCAIQQHSADKCTHAVCMAPLTAITQLHLGIME